jgi:predicted nucleic acid-binding Zn ribbon protein
MSIIDAKNSLDRELKSIPEIHGIGIIENKIVVYLNSICSIEVPKIYKGYHVIIENISISQYIDLKDRGCCDECGEGYDNEPEWRYNTECAVCGEPIPKDKIIKK